MVLVDVPPRTYDYWGEIKQDPAQKKHKRIRTTSLLSSALLEDKTANRTLYRTSNTTSISWLHLAVDCYLRMMVSC